VCPDHWCWAALPRLPSRTRTRCFLVRVVAAGGCFLFVLVALLLCSMLSGLHCAASDLTAPVTEPLPLVVHCHWQPPSARAIHALCWQATEHLRVANPWTILRSTVPRQRPWGQFVGVSRTILGQQQQHHHQQQQQRHQQQQ
jgi:hypothetical protein